MSWFRNLKIKSRMIISFGIIIVLVAVLAVFASIQLSRIDTTFSVTMEGPLASRQAILNFQSDFRDLRRVIATLSTYTGYDPAQCKQLADDARAAYDKSLGWMDQYDKTVNNNPTFSQADKNTRLANSEEVRRIAKRYHDDFLNPMITAADKNDHELSLQTILNGAPIATEIRNKVAEMLEMANAAADDQSAAASASAGQTIIMLVVFGVVVVIISLGLALFISGDIAKDLGKIIDKLSNTAKTVRGSADQITNASSNLAEGSSRNAAAIEETSATMNETESMVAQNAENTRVASQIATTTLNEVNEAGKVMGELMATMTELKESSDKVSRIVKTIDDIAFQTNLLAINATVEAARAGGDAGRSFAVVAQEVRSLAQKSATASGETAEIIEKNITLTNSSRDGAERVGVIAQSNANNIADLNKLISEISAASEEQAHGIRQINTAISQMERSTQDNAAIAEENTALSQELHGETITLDEAIDEASKMI